MYKGKIVYTNFVDSEEELNKALKGILKGKLQFVTQSEDKITLIYEDPDLVVT